MSPERDVLFLFLFLLLENSCPQTMLKDILKDRDFSSEFTFTASRSSGPGGQNVNKVSSKIELRFNVTESKLLTGEEKEIIQSKLASKINSEGEIILVAQSERSQLMNKEKVIEKFYLLIAKALTPVKKRKPTKPSKAAKEKRLEEKRMQAEKKDRRVKGNHA
jgi:ribosome-associated protein